MQKHKESELSQTKKGNSEIEMNSTIMRYLKHPPPFKLPAEEHQFTTSLRAGSNNFGINSGGLSPKSLQDEEFQAKIKEKIMKVI